MKLPPNYVIVPSAMVYSNVPSPIRDTYIQLRGLAWQSNYVETPPVSYRELAELFGKSATTVFEHLQFLRANSWLQFRRAEGSAYRFSFTQPGDRAAHSPSSAEVFENSKTLINTLSDDVNGLTDSEKLINGEMKNRKQAAGRPEVVKRQRDPDLSHPAVVLYHTLTHITANANQRKKIVNTVTDQELWQSAIEHWILHGWRPTNVLGMLASYEGGVQACCKVCNLNSQGNQTRKGKASLADLDSIIQEITDGND